jgi:aryl-alcohol dehydrogenase-like predicted oxidoreductase
MKTSYLDIVYCHDVEFVPFEKVVGEGGALEALYDLKSQGIVKYVGCSGYPLPVLLKIAEHQHQKGQPLDAVLSYCHYTLQNTTLADYAPRFRAAGVRYLFNASPLSMAMFRSAGPPDWHPAHTELRKAAHQCATIAQEHGLDIAELASTFSFSGRDQFGLDTTVIGLQKAEEVERAMEAWKLVKEREAGTKTVPQAEIDAVQKIHEVLAPYKNYSWQSPSDKEMA